MDRPSYVFVLVREVNIYIGKVVPGSVYSSIYS
jgi:hypothetical protein